ncbi:hypothetical protein RDV64_23310 (plasmid) [Acuticoccus sp. MNP-M23]|uniref:hypothetical protein n=1 Tax=Acuticoccus sp. MNP-M23 TaxID=3072793 RepID=UPI002814EB4D|nr:hypothetical protein [Acuticoccus sp. MNP-M23]WMS45299.1 hypothetical protein RDV64_23310 [Acuticoccus sp. MNP-M23]
MSNQSAMNGLIGKIYEILTAADQVNANPVQRKFSTSSHKPFISFCNPGIPLDDLDFGNMETLDQVRRASFFSQFVNSTPSPTGTWQLTSTKTWDIYNLALRKVRLPLPSLSEAEEQMLKRAEEFVREDVEFTDPFTLEKKKEVRPSVQSEQYDRLFSQYAARLRILNNTRITAITNPTPENVLEMTNNGPIYEAQALNAYSQWGSLGYRDYVNQARGIIANFTGRSSFALYERMRAQFDGARRLDQFQTGFYPTFVYPANILSSVFDDAWTKFSFAESEISTFESKESTSWGGGVSGGFGLWSFGAGANYSETKTYNRSDISQFGVEADLIQLPILRGWLNGWIFSSRGWKGVDELNQDGSISSGDYPLDGFMPVLPTSMIVARNVKVHANMEHEENRTFRSELNTSARVGWGPFSLRGNYSHSQSSASHDYQSDASGVVSRGAQIIAFVCDVLPTSPNPDPDIDFPLELERLQRVAEMSPDFAEAAQSIDWLRG